MGPGTEWSNEKIHMTHLMELHLNTKSLKKPLRVSIFKNFLVLKQNIQFFNRDKYCHLTVCLHLIEPISFHSSVQFRPQ